MTIGVEGVHHIGVSVPDLAKARWFYVDLLGAVEEVAPLSWANNPFIDEIVGLKGSTHIEVFEYLSPRSASQDAERGVNQYGYTHFGLQVRDLRACYDRLVAAGIRMHAEPFWDSITTAADGTKQGYCATYCRDPFGNVFEIMEIHEDASIKRV